MFFERPSAGERAVLVHMDMGSERDADDPREFEELVLSAGGDPVAYYLGSRTAPHPGTFVGAGKVEELAGAVREHCAEVVIFNHSLSPSQERNLERRLECRVLDRTGLILDIFAQRARTHEGKLQVELAQLRHMSTRLVRGWTHLERQKGGIGLRGPGETQLETDRRLLRARIKAITARLDKVRRQREQGRRSRRRADVPTIALVGYTNAGKSTLFNRLTAAQVLAADQLFATLDPTLRRVELGEAGAAIIADTVGFISHLPHRLVEAFKATLEETRNADLLVHVVDAASADRHEQAEQVRAVLAEIGADDVPQLEVYNKIDLLEAAPRVERDDAGRPRRVWLSAADGSGLDAALTAIGELVGGDMVARDLALEPHQGRLRAALYRLGAVRGEHYAADGTAHVQVRLPRAAWERLQAAEGAV